MSYPNWVYSMFAFIGFLLSVIPLPWHLEAWNTGTCLFMIWTGLACLNQFINSIVWTGNVINWAPVWCDISTRFMIGSSVAIPAASLCINRRLYYIATANAVTVTKAEKRRAVLVDLAIGLGIPVLEMVLQYIDQGHRFDIYEDIGCWFFTYNTWVAYVVSTTWPLAIGCVSAVYCTLSIRAFRKRRSQFKELLSANSNLNSNRYFRLMLLAGTDIALVVPLSCLSIFLNVTAEPIQPWNGWVNVHSDFSHVNQFPSIIWRSNQTLVVSLETSRWFVVMCSIIFFGYFGFADEARKNYRAAFGSVAKRVGLSTGSSFGFGTTLWSSTSSKSSNGQSGSLPVFVHRKVSRHRDSFDSFTDVSGVGDATSFKEKSFSGDISYGAMSLADVGGALSDMEPSPSDTLAPSLPSPSDSLSPMLPPRAFIRDDDDSHIEISSVRHLSVMSTLPDIPYVERPEITHRDSVDMV